MANRFSSPNALVIQGLSCKHFHYIPENVLAFLKTIQCREFINSNFECSIIFVLFGHSPICVFFLLYWFDLIVWLILSIVGILSRWVKSFFFIFLSFHWFCVYLVATLITLQNKLNKEIKVEIDFFSNSFIEMPLT